MCLLTELYVLIIQKNRHSSLMLLNPWKLASKFQKSGSLKDNLSSPIIVRSVSLTFGKPEKSLLLYLIFSLYLLIRSSILRMYLRLYVFAQRRGTSKGVCIGPINDNYFNLLIDSRHQPSEVLGQLMSRIFQVQLSKSLSKYYVMFTWINFCCMDFSSVQEKKKFKPQRIHTWGLKQRNC